MVLYEDTQKYLDFFEFPQMTSYVFLKSFFAALYKENCKEVSRDITDFLYEMKENNRYEALMEDITFRFNGIFMYSSEIEDEILTLQNVGLLGKRNPSFGRILIEYTEEIVEEIELSLKNGEWELMLEIAKKFIDLQNRGGGINAKD